MSGSKTVTFPVRLSAKDVKPAKWMKADGSETEKLDEAIRFKVRRSPTQAEAIKIEMSAHEIAGGLAAWDDLLVGIENARRGVVAECEQALWPEGRPEATAEIELKQDEQIAEMWDSVESLSRRGWRTLRSLQMRVEFLAKWPVLIVDPEPGWESIADREFDDEDVDGKSPTFYSIWGAWSEAKQAASQG